VFRYTAASMTAAVLTVGTELTRGEITNTNASFIAEALTSRGHDVTELSTVDDDRCRIVQALRRLGEVHSVIVCTGGLGPTTDDLTAESVAEALGVALERDFDSVEAIRARLARAGRELSDSNARQADLPACARVLPNAHGTAPGFEVRVGRAQAFFLPGVPSEMKAMFAERVAPALPPPAGPCQTQIRLRLFGMPESAVNDSLAGIEAAHGVELGYRAHFPELEVKVRARADGEREAQARARAAANEVIARLGREIVYGEGEQELSHVVGQLLLDRGLLLCVAESCTGGLVGQLITDAPGSSAYFVGGAITYSNQAKEQQLGVRPELLATHGAVSAEVARAMAHGARERFSADVAVALTGIAGPGGGSPEKPVGLVHIAVATRAGCADAKMVQPGSRAQVRRRAAFAALALVRSVLLETEGARK